uniref:Uncharacterized protein n=1 Tax=Coccidioides posadasii RMSCC 3488 TaxID=454284 RepID=A0A0J6FI88_COCPO|nr:hypothetical protein CPAG_04880 [Coccidioides posadasii RMSCC 3488]
MLRQILQGNAQALLNIKLEQAASCCAYGCPRSYRDLGYPVFHPSDDLNATVEASSIYAIGRTLYYLHGYTPSDWVGSDTAGTIRNLSFPAVGDPAPPIQFHLSLDSDMQSLFSTRVSWS